MPASDQTTATSTRKRPARRPASPKSRAQSKAGTRQAEDPGQSDRAGARRDEIVRAAAETFSRKGYGATTTQDIADAVGMLKGSLYYYISKKEDLLYEVIDGVQEIWTRNIEHNEVMEGDALTRIWAFVYNNVIGNAMNLVSSAVFFKEFSALTGRRRDHILAVRDLHDNTLRELIREGQADGLVRKGLDAKLAATGILTMCNSLHYWYQADGSHTAKVVAEAYADMAVAALTARPELVLAARERARAINLDISNS